jgi:hypothetical protein
MYEYSANPMTSVTVQVLMMLMSTGRSTSGSSKCQRAFPPKWGPRCRPSCNLTGHVKPDFEGFAAPLVEPDAGVL